MPDGRSRRAGLDDHGETVMRTGLIALALAASYAAALASSSPYQGEENPEITALNAGQVEGLLRGDGMDFAPAVLLWTLIPRSNSSRDT